MTDIRGITTHKPSEVSRERQLALHPESHNTSHIRKRGRRKTEIGYTGLEVFSSIITGELVEHNVDWFDKKRYKIVDRMRKGDATCAATLMAIVLPIISTEVVIEAREGAAGDKPDPIVQEVADFLHYVLFEQMERSWGSWLREALTLYLAYGHYAFEKIFGEIKEGEFKGAMGWKEFAPRHPSTFESWHFDDHGHFRGVEQQAYSGDTGAYKSVELPLDKLLWFTNQEEAGNPLGISVYRPAWKHWKYKDGFYAVQGIAVERQGAGIPFGQYPPGAKGDDVDDLEEMLQNLQAHEQSYITYEEGWDVGFVKMGSTTTLDPADAIEHHDQMIPKSILAGFLNLTQGDRGSFALSADASGFFTFSLQHTANYAADVLNVAAREIIDKNYPDLPAHPKIRFNKVGHISLEKILDGINKLGSQGFITPTLELENHLRNILNLPSLGKDELEEIEETEQAKAEAETAAAIAIKSATMPAVEGGDKKLPPPKDEGK